MTRKLTPVQLAEIEAAAKKVIDAVDDAPWWSVEELMSAGMANGVDPYLIATMDPATTLALVAEVRELRGKVERVRAEVRAEVQRARPRPGESSPDAIRRSMSQAITGRIAQALGEEA